MARKKIESTFSNQFMQWLCSAAILLSFVATTFILHGRKAFQKTDSDVVNRVTHELSTVSEVPEAVKLNPADEAVMHTVSNPENFMSIENFRNYYIVACVMVRDGVSNFPEWIEFHRMMGVDRFVIYDDRSSDGIRLLKNIYAKQGLEHILTFYSAAFGPSDVLDKPETEEEYELKHVKAMNHCYNKVKSQAVWVLFTTSYHYVFPVTSDNLKLELESPYYRDYSLLQILGVPYGTSALQERLGVYTSLSSRNGDFEIRYKPAEETYHVPEKHQGKSGLFPLLIEANTYRLPVNLTTEKLSSTPPSACFDSHSKFRDFCTFDSSTMFVRSFACDLDPYPVCSRITSPERVVTVSIRNHIRSNYYFLRSLHEPRRPFEFAEVEHALSSLDKDYFSKISDDVLSRRFGDELRERLMAFNPQILVPVNMSYY